MVEDDMEAAGFIVHRTGKMVPGDNGEMVEQVIVHRPGEPSPAKGYSRPLPAEATIYFIGPANGPIKIGYATRIVFRLRDLRLANAYHLELLASVVGPLSLEREYHRRFAEHRLHGEWFAPHPDILAEIERLKGRAA